MKTQKAVIDAFFSEFPAFANERKTGKGHNEYTIDCRVTFCDFVDGLQKGGQIGGNLAARVTLGRGNKSKRTTTKKSTSRTLEGKAVIQKYILDCVNLEDYPKSDLPPIAHVWQLFREEYAYPENVKRYGDGPQLFIEWLMGLPTCLSFDYLYFNQRELLESWGIPAPSDDVEMSQKFYRVVEMQFKAMLREGK